MGTSFGSRHRRSAALLLVAALGVAACSSDDDESGADGRGTSQAEMGQADQRLDPAAGASGAPATTVVGGSSVPASNPVVDATEDGLSTFALDVDSASYARARSFVLDGFLPDPSEVRTEEFVNYFDQGYDAPDDGIAVQVDGATAPFLADGTRVVRVGLQAAEVADEDRPDATLTFVIDVSGSMAEGGKLQSVQEALGALVGALRPSDRVGVVVYSDDTREILPSTPVSEEPTILAVIGDLQPEGSTNAEAGLALGYQIARQRFDAARLNRVVLLSDGVANVGATGPDAILETVGQAASEGIDLVTVGFGLGSYHDELMEQLADRGDGFSAYVDGQREAERLFSHDLTGTLQVVAREARAQVAFDPAQVATYRLLGYENRAIADDDFRDDTVDGGEVGAGHSVTALYEVTLAEGAEDRDAPIATATVRYLDPASGEPVERSATVAAADTDGGLADAAATFHLDVLVAAYAESLRSGPWSEALSLDAVASNAATAAARMDDPDATEFADLVRRAAELAA